MNATLNGTCNAGALGTIPVIRVAGRKPKLKNNGYNCYSGQPDLHVPGLAQALPEQPGRPIRQGHVKLVYSQGEEMLTWVSTVRGNDTYSVS